MINSTKINDALEAKEAEIKKDDKGFIWRKSMDYSMFIHGTVIPIRYKSEFDKHLSRNIEIGNSIPIKIVIDGLEYQGKIDIPNSKNRKTPIIRFLYSSKLLKVMLKDNLQVSYKYIMNYIKENNKKPNKIPEEYKEYIDFYKGDDKDTFILKLVSQKSDEFIAKDIILDNAEGAEKEAIVKVIVNQSSFREKLIKKDPTCKICGLENVSLLIASHIKSWKESNAKEKLDENNGFLLCPNHDILFDKHLISLDINRKIIISESISDDDKDKLKINDDIIIDLNKEELKYINYHRKKFFEIEKSRVNSL